MRPPDSTTSDWVAGLRHEVPLRPRTRRWILTSAVAAAAVMTVGIAVAAPGSAIQAAATSFVLFALGAIIPLFPFLVLTGLPAIVVSVVVSTMALFVIGAGITLMTGRGVLFSGMRMVLIGLAAALVTFIIGRIIGVTIAG